MYTIKVLKRRDAASVTVAVVLAMALMNFLSAISVGLANFVTGLSDDRMSSGFNEQYLFPLALLLFELIFLELALRFAVWLRPMIIKNR